MAPVPEVDCSLPGWNDITKPYPNCGQVKFAKRCDDPSCYNHEHHILVKKWCESKDCPVCYPVWASRRAKKASKRLWWIFEREPLRWSKSRRNVAHVQLSPPAELRHMDYRKLLRLGLKMMKQIGAVGGVYIGHPWRFRDYSGNEVQWKHSSLNRYADAPVVESVAVYEPHLHFVVWGWLRPSPEVERSTGWVYTKLSTTPTLEETKAVIAYALTHTGVYGNAHALRWFGRASYNRVQIAFEERAEVRDCCPVCGSGMEYFDAETGTWLPYYIVITRRHYKFREPKQTTLS